ncbi:hypothetical protein P4O66_012736 [Electrophorus voltai]|uniref:Uncharacterized protein n=1 Tax=Electrophorus voltai TaxID=2609070 RepID=A0AAD9DSY1_9TELE|nr:hypothetical protein P4O66_012736 [Electrophorus voltai]
MVTRNHFHTASSHASLPPPGVPDETGPIRQPDPTPLQLTSKWKGWVGVGWGSLAIGNRYGESALGGRRCSEVRSAREELLVSDAPRASRALRCYLGGAGASAGADCTRTNRAWQSASSARERSACQRRSNVIDDPAGREELGSAFRLSATAEEKRKGGIREKRVRGRSRGASTLPSSQPASEIIPKSQCSLFPPNDLLPVL